MKYSDLDQAFTKIIKIMSILKYIWYDSLVVSSQFDIDHTYLDRILGWETFFMAVKCMLSFLSQSCSYILCHLMIIITSFHLDIQYSLGFINSFLASGDFVVC